MEVCYSLRLLLSRYRADKIMEFLLLEFIPEHGVVVILVSVIHILGAAAALHAVMRSRTPQGAVEWSISLITFPYVALPAYGIFGRNRFQGYVLAHKSELAEITSLLDATRDRVIKSAKSLGMSDASILGAENLARIPGTGGNVVELLIDGEATFNSIFEGIESAQHYILVQFYIIRDDNLGSALKTRLIKRADEGVRVLVLYDEIGSFGLSSSWVDDLRAAGISVRAFHSRKGPSNRFQVNFRNHRKIMVVDGVTSWVGGHNVGDEYLGNDPDIGPWRDTHIRIKGPATIPLQLSFVEDWHWATDTLPGELNWQPAHPAEGDTGILIIPSGPADPLETSHLMFLLAINMAKKRLCIASPYFVPDQGIISALQLAALRGVDVRIMIPDNPDHRTIAFATYAIFDEVHRAGVEFYRYTKGFLHQKVMLIDNVFASVGTANFDNRSFRLNFEITALVLNPIFVAQVESMLERDFARCRKMPGDEFQLKPLWFRLAASVSRLLSPVL